MNRHSEGGKATLCVTNFRKYSQCHFEVLAEESFLKGAKLLRHYGTRVNLPLPTGEVDFVSERSEFTKSGEGSTFKVLNATRKKWAFTLSEVLIVLAVLGVIAAMTIPDLVQDYQKKATATQVKKAYSTLNQVITASAADNGPASDYFSAGQAIDADTTKKFFETYWLPYFRVQKVADNGKTLYDDRKPYSLLNGTQVGMDIKTSYVGGRLLFSEASGTIYLIYIAGYVDGVEQYTTTQSVFVDINGTKGPNIWGKDVFRFVVDTNDSVVNPYGYDWSQVYIKNGSACLNEGVCAAKIKRDGWEIADDYPW